MKNKNHNSRCPNVPRETSPKPSYDTLAGKLTGVGRFISGATRLFCKSSGYIPIKREPSLEAVRSYRLFLVVAYDTDGVATPVLYTEDVRFARKFASELVCPVTGNRVPAEVFPLEIPRYYFK